MVSKPCTKCGRSLPLADFAVSRMGANGPILRPYCKECGRAANAAWRKANKAKLAAYDAARATPERRAACIAWQHENREKLKVTTKRWRDKNPSRAVIQVSKRRAAKLRATPPWYDASACDWAYVASKMVERMDGVRYSVDHIVPLVSDTVCGLHVSWNLAVVPHSENAAKGNRWWPDGW